MKYGDLVSIIIATYNHEKYISECLYAACNQTYPNIEVIVCDDNSSDDTFKEIQKFKESYSGKANLITIKNSNNIGAIKNYQKCISLCSGEIIIEQDGDDIALLNRVEENVRVFVKDSSIKAIFSNAIYTDENGTDQGLYFEKKPEFISKLEDFEKSLFTMKRIFTPYVWMLGATGAFTKEIFTKFDEIDPKARHEDGVFSFRALLLGQLEYLDSPLVRYRRHSNAVSAPQNFKGRLKLQRTEYYYFKTQYKDAIKIGASKKVISKVSLYKNISFAKSVVFRIPIIGAFMLKLLVLMSNIWKRLK